MAQVKVTAKVIEDPESTAAAEDLIHWSEGEEDISQVEADPSELMGGREKPESTLRFGPSLVADALIRSYVEKG